uniref:ADP-ribosyl cyclase/cyclic ADP-ribose hydrolase n=1 Tax=Araucaria cunninghamii TaxID=56994 RepID=A0A0D6QV16_ARACU
MNENGAFDQVAQPTAFAYPPSSSTQPKSRCPVFVNHRGTDVKRTFAHSIRYILDINGVQAFVDDKDLQEGDPFPKKIQEAMDNASLYIAIFSKSYAESSWCLTELSYMLKTGRRIIPIFYQVEPSDLRWAANGKGIYANSFAEHERKGRYEAEKLREWKEALQTVSYREGYVLKENDWGGVFESLTNRVVTEISHPSQGEYPDAGI